MARAFSLREKSLLEIDKLQSGFLGKSARPEGPLAASPVLFDGASNRSIFRAELSAIGLLAVASGLVAGFTSSRTYSGKSHRYLAVARPRLTAQCLRSRRQTIRHTPHGFDKAGDEFPVGASASMNSEHMLAAD